MDQDNQFGMTEQDIKGAQRNAIFAKIKYYFSAIEPGVLRIVQAFFYYLIRFIKAFVTTIIRMILGKEI